jgi:flavin reductase (DIM6/NTAB) family NADH-FMN oxidoreductase RutF
MESVERNFAAISLTERKVKIYSKRDFPGARIRHFLESGPVVLVSSAWKGRSNIMTMGWHAVIEFSPSLVGCVIAESNHSFEMIRRSRECVINLPTADLVDVVVGIGNCSGDRIDKFAKFGLTSAPGKKVAAPLIRECFANFECRVADTRLVKAYNFFILEVVKAHVPASPKFPKTLHYHGRGMFTTSGGVIDKARKFTKWKNVANF